MKYTKYNVDESFFTRDTAESFYWAGFIAADGCVFYTRPNKTSGFLGIGLSSVDRDMLIKFKECIRFNGQIKDKATTKHNPNGTSKIQISRVSIVKSLERFNIVPNKTKVYTFPNWIKFHSLVNHFMRGYLDGDGSFYITKQSNRNHLCFSLCGTKEFLNDYRNILASNCNLKLNKICKSRGIWDVKYAGNPNTFKIREFLYMNSKYLIQMDRKYKR